MQSNNVRALALVFGITGAQMSEAHDKQVLEACPTLQPGKVKTQVIDNDLSLVPGDYNSVSDLVGTIEHFNASTVINHMTLEYDTNAPDKRHLVLINSPGGDRQQAYAIAKSMDRNGAAVTYCQGDASSAALTILANGAAGYRYAASHCEGVAHGGTTTIQATASQIQKYLEKSKKYEDLDQAVMMRDGMMDKKCYDALDSNGDHYLDAKDMLNLGIVDAFISEDGQKMTVRAGDPRIAQEACMKKGLPNITMQPDENGNQKYNQDEYNALYATCHP